MFFDKSAEHIRARGGKAEAAADIPAGVARAVDAGGYNNKDCFMRETDQEGYVDFVKTVRIL